MNKLRRFIRSPGISRLKNLSLAVIVSFIVVGCAGLGEIVKPPEARIVSVDLVRVDFTSVSLRVNVEIDNPNPIGLTLSAYDWGLDAAENTILEGRVEDQVSLRAADTSILPIPIEVRFDSIVAARAAIQDAETLPVGLRLGLEVALPYMGTVRLDVGADTEIPILKPPTVRPESIRVDRISLSGADITLVAVVGNPNAHSLVLRTLEGRLTVGERDWGVIGLSSSTELGANADRTVSLRASVDFGEVGRSAWSLLTGTGSAEVRLSGDMDIDMDLPGFDGKRVPLETGAKVSIVR